MKKGVSMLVVVVAVSVMLILITSSIIIGADAVNTAQYEEFLSQLNRVSGSVNQYILDYNKLPVTDESILGSSLGEEFLYELRKKGDENNKLYIVDVDLLKDPTIKRGYGTAINKDVFVIAENTNNVYYVKGFKYKKITYFGSKLPEI